MFSACRPARTMTDRSHRVKGHYLTHLHAFEQVRASITRLEAVWKKKCMLPTIHGIVPKAGFVHILVQLALRYVSLFVMSTS